MQIEVRMQEWAKKFYNSAAWDATRAAYLLSVNGLCERCLRRGIVTPAKVVHHKKYLTPKNIGTATVTLSWDNLEALCQDCHNSEHHQHRKKRYTFDANGHIIPPILTPSRGSANRGGEERITPQVCACAV